MMQNMFQITAVRGLGRLGAVALIAVAVGAAGCKSSPDRTMGQRMSDRQVAKAVKKDLGKDPMFKYTHVEPNVYSGTVQLTGFVESPEQRLRAAEIAAQAKGARQVVNEIMIKPMPTGAVAIRDPLGHSAALMMVDTNAPLPQFRNVPGSVGGTQSESGGEGANRGSNQGSSQGTSPQ